MIKKSNHRFPFLKCMKLLDVYLTQEYFSGYIMTEEKFLHILFCR